MIHVKSWTVLCYYIGRQGCMSESLSFKLNRFLLKWFNIRTAWSWVLLDKPPVAQLVKNSSAFYGIWRFITVFTRALQKYLFWARSIQSIQPSTFCIKSINLLSYHLRLLLPSGLISSSFPTNIPYAYLFSTCVPHAIPITPFLPWSF
jgi:hypothetical protein